MKLFVSDYDMTLYINEHIDEKVLDAIKKWREAGNIFVIATGRNKFSIFEQIEKYNIGFDYLIANNGALIFDNERKIIFKETIEENEAYKVVKSIFDKFGATVEIATDECIISVQSKVKNDILYSDAFKIGKIINIEEIDSIKNIIQINKMTNDIEKTKTVADFINDNFEEVIAYGNIRTVDIVDKKVNKASGIAFLENKLKDKIEKIFTAGDSNNDIDMIKKYDGYVHINAGENIKKITNKYFSLISDIMNENL